MDTLTASAPSRQQPGPPAAQPAAPADGHVHRRDLGGATPWLFYGGLVVAAVLVLMTAGGLDVAGNILGILGGGLLHGAVAALVRSASTSARLTPDWTFLKGGQHALMLLALLIVAPVTFLVDRFVLHLGLAVVPAVAYVVVAVASAVGAGAMTFLVVCPSHLGRRQRAVFLPFVGLFGLAAGVLAMALVVAGLAVWRMHRLPDVHISVPTVSGIEGDYVALGRLLLGGRRPPPVLVVHGRRRHVEGRRLPPIGPRLLAAPRVRRRPDGDALRGLLRRGHAGPRAR
jgi:hypothetical protein